jgi:hypothetical protein
LTLVAGRAIRRFFNWGTSSSSSIKYRVGRLWQLTTTPVEELGQETIGALCLRTCRVPVPFREISAMVHQSCRSGGGLVPSGILLWAPVFQFHEPLRDSRN